MQMLKVTYEAIVMVPKIQEHPDSYIQNNENTFKIRESADSIVLSPPNLSQTTLPGDHL